MEVDIPLGEMRPELDQIPGSCKNWFTVNRWVDVANSDYGITWVTLDAPLIEVGGLTATLLGSQKDPTVWRKKVGPTQKLYSWAMNNHWGTNYRAYQEGLVRFRYLLRPHRKSTPDEATRFAIGFSQPLIIRPAHGAAAMSSHARLRVSPESVTMVAMKPSDDGKALIVRLYGASGHTERATLSWSEPTPGRIWLSDTSEQPVGKVEGSITVPAREVVTLRAELP